MRSDVGEEREGPIALSDGYRRWIEALEARPENQSGADKSWVEAAVREFREHYAHARRLV
jgi:hypothetical protein